VHKHCFHCFGFDIHRVQSWTCVNWNALNWTPKHTINVLNERFLSLLDNFLIIKLTWSFGFLASHLMSR
jgi:hypothetical protein